MGRIMFIIIYFGPVVQGTINANFEELKFYKRRKYLWKNMFNFISKQFNSNISVNPG